MDVNRYLEHCNEQNRQVCERDKINLHSPTNSGRKLQNPSVNTMKDENSILEARVRALKETMLSLKAELLEEKALWRREMEDMNKLMVGNDRPIESDPNLAAESENDFKSIVSVPTTGSDPAVANSPLIREYEEKLNRYQGALAQAQAEKRFNIRRQIAANTYRKRLNEVEKLCQEELAKVRETATYLEPLKQMASEWSRPAEAAGSSSERPVRRRTGLGVECGDFLQVRGRETQTSEETESYDVPVKQIDASLVMDEDASNEIKGKIVLQIESLPSEVPTICYSAKFE